MKAGDRIRLDVGFYKCVDLQDYTAEEFRFCLGVFLSDAHRKAGKFTPLCELYGAGPDSEEGYISNFGGYITNEVPIFMNIT